MGTFTEASIDEVKGQGLKVIGSRFVMDRFKKKARLVVQDVRKGPISPEHWAPTPSSASLKTLLALGASKGHGAMLSDISSAFLYAQLQDSVEITAARLKVWFLYHQAFQPLEEEGLLERPFVPKDVEHNAHMYFLILDSIDQRTSFIQYLKSESIGSVFHYVPLHTSPAGKRFGRACGSFPGTFKAAERLVRLPMGCEIDCEKVISVVYSFFGRKRD